MFTIPIILAILLLALLGAGGFFLRLAFFPRMHSVVDTYREEVKEGKLVPEVFSKLPQEEVHIRSPYGYDLYGLYFPQPGARKTAIICHGITWTLYGSVKYMDLFRKRGFNLLLYDHRGHGHSGGRGTFFGLYEKHDLRAVTDWALARLGEGGRVGVLGESLGAATALQNAALDPRVSFYIADCPFSSLEGILRYHLRRDYHLPAFPLFHVAAWLCRLALHFSFDDICPLRDMERAVAPILFIHGLEDDYVPTQMSRDLCAHKPGAKRLYLPHGGHAQAYWQNREEYDRVVGEFLAEIGL